MRSSHLRDDFCDDFCNSHWISIKKWLPYPVAKIIDDFCHDFCEILLKMHSNLDFFQKIKYYENRRKVQNRECGAQKGSLPNFIIDVNWAKYITESSSK